MLKERVVEVKFAEGVVGEAIGACCADECDLSCQYVRLTSTAQFRNSNVGSIRAFFIDTARLLIALFQAPLPASRWVHETDTRHRFLFVTVEITWCKDPIRLSNGAFDFYRSNTSVFVGY